MLVTRIGVPSKHLDFFLQALVFCYRFEKCSRSRTDILEKSAFFFYKLVLSENFSRLEFLKGIFIVLDSFEELLATYIFHCE